jgi:hypothetical protein
MATLAPKLPYTHPFAGGFPYRGSQRLPSDPDALAYLAAVAAADGAPVETAVATAVDDFFRGIKADGTFSAIRSACLLCGARTLAGALVPLKNEGPELWAEQTPAINDADGSAAEWNAATLTMSNTSPTTAIIRPRFDFNVGLENGKQYRLSGRLSGDLASIRNSSFQMGNTGANIVIDPSSGLFDSIGTASGVILPLLITFNGSLGPFSVTIESLSIREVIAAPTNVADGFVEGDYTRGGATPGLKGDGTSYLNTGRAVTADPQNNCHVSAFRSDLNGSEFSVASLGLATTGAVVLNHANPISGRLRNTSFTSGTLDGSLGFAGFSRQDSGFFSARADAQSETITQVSAISGSVGNYGVFMFLNGLAFSTATIAFYSIGESLDLAALDARVTALVTAIGAAV